MPDVTTVTDAAAGTEAVHDNRRVITNPSTIYLFYLDTSTNLVVGKSTDGGATFGAATVINAGGTVGRWDLWRQRWTTGRTGTLVLLAFDDGGGNVKFRTFDTSDDSLGSEVFAINRAGSAHTTQIKVCEARSGNIGVAWDSNDSVLSNGFVVSTNGGGSFALRDNPFETLQADKLLLAPGNETDADDFYAPFHDTSVSALSLKHYDDSADNWIETAIVGGMGLSSSKLWGVSQLHSDNHLFLPMFTALSMATTDLRFWEITNPSTIVERSNVITNDADAAFPAITIDQQTGRIYVFYSKGPTFGTRRVRYKTSDDRGLNWSSEIFFSDVERDTRALAADLSIGNDGGRIQPGWYEAAGNNLFSNVVNDIQINPAGAGSVTGQQQKLLLL
jgi:hypothetical protein